MVSKKSIGRVAYVKLFGLKRGDRVKKNTYSCGDYNCYVYGNIISIYGTRICWIVDRERWTSYDLIDNLIPVFTTRESWLGQVIDWKATDKLPLTKESIGLRKLENLRKAGLIKLKVKKPFWYSYRPSWR